MTVEAPPVPLWKPVAADPARFFDAELVARAKRYQRPKQRLGMLRSLAGAGVLVALVASGFGPELVGRLGDAPWPLALLVVLAATGFILQLTSLPSAIWEEFVHEKRWGFSNRSARAYALDEVKQFLVFGVAIAGLLLVPLWAFVRWTDLWWLWGALVLALIAFALSVVYPLVVLPLFNRFTPLADDELRARLETLVRRSGITIERFLVMDASKRSKKDNAFFVGVGGTRRIVLYDTLLSMPPECIEVVVAHEIGHWRRRHTLVGPAISIVQLPLLLGLTAAVVTWEPALRWADVSGAGDPGALPLFLLVFGGAQTLLGRADAWLSRWFERQADHDALELTRAPAAFRHTWDQMVDRNLPDVAPSWWRRTALSHPPVAERMAFGEAWSAARATP